MRLIKFTVKDVAFLAVMAALLLLCAAVAMPLMTITLFGLRNMATCIFYGLFLTIALMKVPKPGAVTLLCIFNGAVLLMMSPVMSVTMAVSALLAELVALLLFRTYENKRAILTAAVLQPVFGLPFTLLFAMLINGQTFADVVGMSWLVLLTTLGTIVLSVAGALLGRKIGGELKKAGKLL